MARLPLLADRTLPGHVAMEGSAGELKVRCSGTVDEAQIRA
jgi:hypothetical protein